MILKELLALRESKGTMYQVRVETQAGGDWKDMKLGASSIEDIADSVSASTHDTKAHNKFDVSELTEIIEDFIGSSPSGKSDSTWDEMDIDVKSLKHDVLKLSFTFGGTLPARKGEKYRTPYEKNGTITIMPS
jgi:hypothetical protein